MNLWQSMIPSTVLNILVTDFGGRLKENVQIMLKHVCKLLQRERIFKLNLCFQFKLNIGERLPLISKECAKVLP